MLERTNETIVAVSSAAGRGAVGIVRLSGSCALSIARKIVRTCTATPISAVPGATRLSGDVVIDDDLRLPASIYLFRAPHSYTREDIVEIQTIGSPPALEMLLGRAQAAGAVLAEAGEFTARAFFNGAMDLTKAEAVAGLIRAQSDTQLRAARRLMDGRLARQTVDLRDELAECLALVEADIDFSEEPIEFITPRALRDRIGSVTNKLKESLRTSQSVEHFEQLPHVLLLGRPNAGKSSLMNRLSETRRAICEAAAGTTRDILTASIRIGRGEALLMDSAGVDQSPDDIIAQARALTLSAAERVDLVCVVIDLTDRKLDALAATVRFLDVPTTLVVANKCDLLGATDAARNVERLEALGLGPVHTTSATEGTGIENLRDAIADALGRIERTTSQDVVLLSDRQRRAIDAACAALQRAGKLSENATEMIDCADLVAFELREALDELASVTGDVSTEDLLSHVFANFCIGK